MTGTAFDRITWLAARRCGIGGSDIAAVMGDPGTCGRKLAYQKLGAQPDYDDEPRLLRLGRYLEHFAAEEYARHTGRTLALPEPGKLYFHPEVRIAFASPDRFIVAEPNGATYDPPGVLEIKTHGPSIFRDVQLRGATDANTRQLHWTLGCTDGPFGAFTHLDRDGADLLAYDIQPHTGLISTMLEAAQRWWRDHIVAEELPPPLPTLDICGDCAFRRTCKGVTSAAASPPKVKHPEPPEVSDAELADAAHQYDILGNQADGIEAARKEARDRILAALARLHLDAAKGGDAENGTFKVYAREQESWRWDPQALLALPPVLRVEGDLDRAVALLEAAGITAAPLLLRDTYRLRSVSRPVRVHV